jgi:dihydrofolate reductase
MKKPLVSAIAAIGAKNRALGKDNKLLWTIPDDLKRFREITRGHPVIMGRKTFESILSIAGKPLPDRPNIVITRDGDWAHPGAIVVHSVEEAIEKAKQLDQEEIFIIGGGEIYKAALPYTDKLYLTLIEDEKEADTFFSPYEDQFRSKTFDEGHEWNGIPYRFVNLER